MLPDIHTFWNIVLMQLEQRIKQEYVAWLQTNTVPVHINDTVFTLQVAKPYQRIWLENTLLQDVATVAGEMNGTPLEVQIVTPSTPIQSDTPVSPPSVPDPTPVSPSIPSFSSQSLSVTEEKRQTCMEKLPIVPSEPIPTAPVPAPSPQPATPAVIDTDSSRQHCIQINPNYTFSNFIVGTPNQMAYASAKSVAEFPAQQQNPFFIYGKSGLGKTHLMHAICNYVHTHAPDKNVLFLSSEQFTNDFISSLSKRDIYLNQQFRDKYRHVDYLLIDDVQFFGNKDGTQEEFFHTFNELLNYNKQIVMTCDRLPEDIEKLENRLTSRFSAGLVVEIKPPDFEIRSAYLKQLAQEKQFPLLSDIIAFIAENFYQNMRDVEKAFNRLLSYHKVADPDHYQTMPMSLSQAKEYVADLLPKNKRHPLDTHSIIDECAHFYKVDRKKILGKSRPKNIATARQVAMYLCRELLDCSFTDIGTAFNRDHTTIMYAYEKITKKIAASESFKKEIHQLIYTLTGDNPVNE